MRWFSLLLLSSLLGVAVGCGSVAQGISAINPFERKFVTADPTNPAIEVACIWQPSEGPNAQGVPVRGFAGQMFFFTKKNSEPVLVDGDVRVYLFADRGTPEERGKPMHQYDFTPEAWSSHATLTSLGPGYSIFVPYPGSEAYQVRCQLRTRFTPKEGPPIWSEAMTMILEGPPRPGQEPHSWTNSEGGPRTSSTNTIAVSNQRGTFSQLQSGDMENQSTERKLRTDTFSLGGIQQISHERPEQPENKGPASLPPEIETKLESLRRQEREAPTRHPLNAAGNIASQQESHPLKAKRSTPAIAPVGPTRNLHPLNQRDRLLEPLPPLGSEPNRYRYKMFPPRGAERAQDANALNTPRPYSVPLNGTSTSSESTGVRAASSTASNEATRSSDYGVWQPMTE